MSTEQALTTEETPAAERRTYAEGGAHGAHPTDSTYIIVAAVLAAITAIEVGLSYSHLAYLTNASLLVLAVAKFAMVVMFFMHLRFDSRLFRWVFCTGLFTATIVYLIVLSMFHVFRS